MGLTGTNIGAGEGRRTKWATNRVIAGNHGSWREIVDMGVNPMPAMANGEV
jgi:hypothetical protein